MSDEYDLPPAVAAKRTIRYADDDIEIAPERSNSIVPGSNVPKLRRHGSTNSFRSERSMSRGIDPALALPAVYRTVSFNITTTQEHQAEASKEAKRNVGGDFADTEWHTLDHLSIYKKLETTPDSGLSASQVAEKQAQYGRNVPSKPPSQLFRKIFGYFFGGFGSILFVGAILVFIAWKPLGQPPQIANLALAIVLVGVWVIQAVFNAWQDFSSSKVMNSITGMLPEDCHVLREGGQRMLPAADVVPGDILYFKAGSKLTADIRFIETSSDAKFDRSILTGESVPVAAFTESSESNYLETKCIGMQGTHCTSGSGSGVVVATADQTVFGHIAKLTSTPSTERTPLQKEILRFVFIIVSLMVLMNIVIVAVWAGYIRKNYPDYMPVNLLIVSIVSVAIAFVPEGLPIAFTASLTIVAHAMKKQNILCKSLKTVETLGSVSVLLCDKTGTLTRGRMIATDCLIGFDSMSVDDAERELLESRGTSTPISAPKAKAAGLSQLQMAAAVNNAGEFDPTTIHHPLADRKIIGDATDAAILRLSEKLGSSSKVRATWRVRYDLGFNSKNKFALRVAYATDRDAVLGAVSAQEATAFDSEKDMLLLIKGAPDILMSRCTSFIDQLGEVHPTDSNFDEHLEKVKDEWSSQGKRVLLLARKVLRGADVAFNPADGNYEEEALRHAKTGLTLIGLAGIVDPPRDEIPNVVSTLRRAGIRIHMVTGDFRLTAEAIAHTCGILTRGEKADTVADLPRSPKPANPSHGDCKLPDQGGKSLIISGPEIVGLSEHQWDLVTMYPAVVFARTTPDQKLLITRSFRRRGQVVGMTGDGVNDAPSLREADIGICPVTASDIAIAASDMVLLDSFASIIIAVERGRTVFDNLKKTIAYLLPAGSFSEFWPVMTSVVFGLPQILSSFLMIVICCFTDCAAATALAFEEPEADVMLRKPRDLKKDKLVDWRLLLQAYGLIGLIETTTSFAMSFWYLQRQGIPFSSLWFSFGNYVTPAGYDSDYINYHLAVASAIYFVNLVIMQWFNSMSMRTRRTSLFTQPPIRFMRGVSGSWLVKGNWYLFPAILIALVMVFIFCYIPGLQEVAVSNPIPGEYWGLGFVWGVLILSIEEIRKMLVRRSKGGFWEKIAW
ncbi:MAG: hypothetical protein M1825_004895 [Sarcosagium campestre]|nr:MAG: hypothetical protein M1825_004895 [Sarcosagium campestre]